MDNEKLKKSIELKKQIDELESFLEYMNEFDLEGKATIKKNKFKFGYKNFLKKEKTFIFNDRLTFNVLIQVKNELDDLKKKFKKL